jgi:ubiquinone/menaquinone biosynthesis C-methylase UbiE
MKETPLLDTNYLKLVTYGRRTGLPHIVLLRYVELGKAFYVVAGDSNSDWYRNALFARSARVRIGEFIYSVSVELASSHEKDTVKSIFLKKYGSRIVRTWYRDFSNVLKLVLTSPPAFRGLARGENETFLTFKQWKSSGDDYLDSVAKAFDSASEEYDFTIGQNYINRFIRKVSIQTLLKYVKKEDVLLEVGCGTGKEAVTISKHVSKIYATDISDSMLRLLSLRIKSLSLDKKIIPIKMSASEVSNIARITEDKINVIYSFNGALNCEPNLNKFAFEAYSLLPEGGYLICSVRNILCISEMLIHGLIFQMKKATPRKVQPMMISVGGYDIPAMYYYPHRFIEYFKKYFTLVEMRALPVLVPPAYLSNYYVRLGRIRYVLEKLEKYLAGYFPLCMLGDQTLFVFRKSSNSNIASK